MAIEDPPASRRKQRSSLYNIVEKIQLIYYQYSVTLPVYGLTLGEKIVLNSLVIISAFLLVQLGFHLLGTSIYWLRLLLVSMRRLFYSYMNPE